MLIALAYNLLLFLASPLLALYLAHRLLVKGKSREGFGQRLGWSPRLSGPTAGRIWLHAVSAGEVVAAAAIARRLRERVPQVEIVISTTTPAGQQQARKLLPYAAAWFYFPFDFLPCVLLALLRIRPTVVACVETEIWPNWLAIARLLGARAALVNGQFADRGFRGARRARWLYCWALGHFDALWMQTTQAAERARFLGAPSERVRVVGNVKFEQELTPPRPEVVVRVGELLGLETGRPLWVAGSTHPGEEEQVLTAFRTARAAVPNLALLLAPRHVERAEAVLDLVRADGWQSERRSTAKPTAPPCDVVVLDTMGELSGLYSLAQVVFVGGSLAPIGGHDILQPIFQGAPTLFGPYMHNQQDLARLALEASAAVQVADADALGAEIIHLLTSLGVREQLINAGERLLRENRGAAVECAQLLAELAGSPSPGPTRERDDALARAGQ